jgi:hypothetical protein
VTWLLLIYTVPSAPSRKRAAVWREIKRAGAIYLRDGVAVLPERDETRTLFQAIAAKIEAFGGQVTLVAGARFDAVRQEAIIAAAQAARAEEFAEIDREVTRLLAHVERERAHRALTATELTVIAADLGKLRRWKEQVEARDAFGTPAAAIADATFRRAEQVVDALHAKIAEQAVQVRS